jgi:ABC-type glycerol-3-phosphate transport system substrate-binding protein
MATALLIVASLWSNSSAQTPAPPTETRTSVTLQVLVVNDTALAEAIERLRGEWHEQSGGELTAAAKAWSEISAAKTIDADVIIFPTRYLGELCVKHQLRPVRKKVLDDKTVDVADFFPLARRQLITWGGQVMALPLGVDLPVMCYRHEFFVGGKKMPDSWASFARLEAPIHGHEDEARLSAIREPLDSWASTMLLVRAASYAISDDQAAILFDPKSMKPQIEQAPFVRALNELREAYGNVAREEPRDETDRKLRDPRAASWEVATGYAQIAIGLPPAGHRGIVLPMGKLKPATGNEHLGWTEVPGADEIFKSASMSWEKQNRIHRVPVLGVGDRLAGVTSSSRNAASAFKLLAWLAQPDLTVQLARVGDGAAVPVRKSLASSATWYDRALSTSERIDLGKTLETALNGNEYLIVPRIPGIDEYLAALDEAVKQFALNHAKSEDVLQQAAEKWEKITEAHGREAQRQAYLKHLGISE